MAFASKALRTALTLGALASAATILPASAQVATCTGSYDAATVFGGWFTCQAGDKIYSNFTNISSNQPLNFSLSIVDADPFHTVATSGAYSGAAGTGTNFSFSYTITVDPLVLNRVISSYSTDVTVAGNTLGNTKSLAATAGVSTITRKNQADSNIIVIPGGSISVDFTSSLFVVSS